MTFLKTFWAALLAFVVANILLGVLSVMIFAGFIAAIAGESVTTVEENSILKIEFKDAVVDSPNVSPTGSIDLMSMKLKTQKSLFEVLNALEVAATDDKIKGIYLNLSDMSPMSLAIAEELRAELIKFKETGKFIVAYSEVYTKGRYYIASVSDKIYMNPEGGMEWIGISSNVMFYKGLLDKLGIQPEVLRHGTFKAAVEPFIATQMSPENRLQMNTLLGSVWGTIVGDIASSRGIDSVSLQNMATNLTIDLPESAVENKLIDSLAYKDQVMSALKSLVGEDADEDKDDDPKFVSLSKYIGSFQPSAKKISNNKVALIYADGDIVDGSGEEGKVGSANMAKKLAKLRKDDDVKAVVIRVNSPGGSALASEVMWREIELLRKEKPVVVSMGSVAASGGYYIAAPADIIIADRMTITGSIGVFGLLFNAERGLRDKLGITVDIAKTNPSADMGVPFRKLSTVERDHIMRSIERVYKTFVGHVATGRNMSFEAVDAVGGGRIWSGVDAKEIGLIDGFGGLKHAIALAADRAGVAEDFRVSQVLEEEDSFTALFKALSKNMKASVIENQMGEMFVYYNNLMSILETEGVQARMPYQIEIN